MENKFFSIDYNNLLNENDTGLSDILNSLPFGITLQSIDRIILYENEKAKELTGSYKNHQCFTRWMYLEGEGNTVCKDCPATISLIDGVKHKVFRKTITKDNKDIFLEIQSIPVLNKNGTVSKYIEILNDVSNDEKIKSLVDNPVSKIIENLEFSVSIYGKTGGEILLKDQLQFFTSPIEYIQRLSLFTYIGIFQNYFNQIGLFGPLPVLDNLNKSMMVYSFRLHSSSVTDPRIKGTVPCLFYVDQ